MRRLASKRAPVLTLVCGCKFTAPDSGASKNFLKIHSVMSETINAFLLHFSLIRGFCTLLLVPVPAVQSAGRRRGVEAT